MLTKLKSTLDVKYDNLQLKYLFAPCAVLALFFNEVSIFSHFILGVREVRCCFNSSVLLDIFDSS